MLGNWIAWTKGLPFKREVLVIAKALQVDRRIVACMCMEVWEWADEQTTDGSVQGVSPLDIDAMLGCRGFALAMIDAGWIVLADGGLTFPNWDRWNTESAKRRLQNIERVRRHRKAHPEPRGL